MTEENMAETIDGKTVIKKEVKRFGDGGHIVMPKDLVGKKVSIILPDK